MKVARSRSRRGPIRVLVATDDRLFRDAVSLLLGREPDIGVVGTAGDATEAIARIRLLTPDVAVLDQESVGLGVLHALRDFPQTRLLILTGFDSPHYLHAVVEARGGLGYLRKKSTDGVELVGAVRSLADGNAPIPQIVTRQVLNRLRHYEGLSQRSGILSDREFDVLEMVVAGAVNKEIADRLGITESTVKVYLRTIFSTIGARNRAHAVKIAFQEGLIPFPVLRRAVTAESARAGSAAGGSTSIDRPPHGPASSVASW